jgi:two-component system, OmpR family, response regulator
LVGSTFGAREEYLVSRGLFLCGPVGYVRLLPSITSIAGVMSKKVLVVDNESGSRRNISLLLREQGYEVDEADDGLTALDLLDKTTFDPLICDVVMPRLSGLDVIRRIESSHTSTSVILITGHPDLLDEKGLGHFPCFTKPFNLYDLLRRVKQALSD